MYNEFGTVVGAGAHLRAVHGADADRRDRPHRRAAGGGGAQPRRRAALRAFLEVTLPLSLPGILAGSLLVFALAISAYVTPSLMGGTDVLTLPMLIYQQVGASFNLDFAGALGVVLLLVSLGHRRRLQPHPRPAVGRAGAGMSASPTSSRSMRGRAGLPRRSTARSSFFLLAPIAVVHRVRAQPDALHLRSRRSA